MFFEEFQKFANSRFRITITWKNKNIQFLFPSNSNERKCFKAFVISFATKMTGI